MREDTRDFIRFLKEYGVIGLAIAVVIGTAAKDLVSATVDDFIMPIVEIFLPGSRWEEALLVIGPVEFGIGHFLSVLLEFLIIALLVYIFMKRVMKQEKVEKL